MQDTERREAPFPYDTASSWQNYSSEPFQSDDNCKGVYIMKKVLFTALIVSALCFSMQAFAAAPAQTSVITNGIMPKGPGIGPGPGAPQASIPEAVNVPETAKVLVTVESGMGETSGMLKLFTKTGTQQAGASLWTEVLSTKAMLGKNGLGKEKEGDNKTPMGVFKMNTPFGIKDALPGFPENYLKVNKNHYWCGDSASAAYNKLVDASAGVSFSRSASEHLIDYAGYYDYCIDSGYNPDGTPYKGSALFLHCAVGGQTTHGCIAIPEKDMIEVLKHYREGDTYIAVYDRADPTAVCRK